MRVWAYDVQIEKKLSEMLATNPARKGCDAPELAPVGQRENLEGRTRTTGGEVQRIFSRSLMGNKYHQERRKRPRAERFNAIAYLKKLGDHVERSLAATFCHRRKKHARVDFPVI